MISAPRLHSTTRGWRGLGPGWSVQMGVLGVLILAAWLLADVRGLVQVSAWLIYGTLVLSLALLWGQGGIVSFGHNALFGIGAYLYGIVAINALPVTRESMSAFLAAGIGAAVVAGLLGYFVFYARLGSLHVAVVTLAFALMLYTFMAGTAGGQYRVGAARLGGYNGMTGIPPIVLGGPGLGGLRLDPRAQFVFFALFALLAYAAMSWLSRRPFGRIVSSIRENELRSELLGYDVPASKLALFVVSGLLAGLAGACFAAWGQFVDPSVFGLQQAALVVIWFLVGGRRTLFGGFLGAALVQGLASFLGAGAGQGQTPLILGIVLILLVLLLPDGLGGLVETVVARFGVRRSRPVVPLLASVADGQVPALVSDGPDNAALEVQHVTKSFDGVRAVDGVSLTIGGRGIHCLIGPNGAGKSTLFNLLVGRYRPDSGTIHFGGLNITHVPAHRRARLGMGIKLQVPSLYPGLTAFENVWLAAFARLRRTLAAKERALHTLAAVGLLDQGDTPAAALSHGHQQSLEIGVVMAADPGLILLDEPTAGLTRGETNQIARLVHLLAERANVVVVEHDMEFIRQLDSSVTVLHQGRILASGSIEEVRGDPRVLDVYLGRDPRAAAG